MSAVYDDAPDRGAEGEAAIARNKVIKRVEIRISSTRTEIREECRYTDAVLFDRMHYVGQLSDRQHQAGLRLYGLWTAAGLNPKVAARYGEALDRGEEAEGPQGDEGDGTPRERHRRLLRTFPDRQAHLLDQACLDRHPGGLWLRMFQEALDMLGDIWGLERGRLPTSQR